MVEEGREESSKAACCHRRSNVVADLSDRPEHNGSGYRAKHRLPHMDFTPEKNRAEVAANYTRGQRKESIEQPLLPDVGSGLSIAGGIVAAFLAEEEGVCAEGEEEEKGAHLGQHRGEVAMREALAHWRLF